MVGRVDIGEVLDLCKDGEGRELSANWPKVLRLRVGLRPRRGRLLFLTVRGDSGGRDLKRGGKMIVFF